MSHTDNIELEASTSESSVSESTDFYIEEVDSPAAAIQQGNSMGGGSGNC